MLYSRAHGDGPQGDHTLDPRAGSSGLTARWLAPAPAGVPSHDPLSASQDPASESIPRGPGPNKPPAQQGPPAPPHWLLRAYSYPSGPHASCGSGQRLPTRARGFRSSVSGYKCFVRSAIDEGLIRCQIFQPAGCVEESHAHTHTHTHRITYTQNAAESHTNTNKGAVSIQVDRFQEGNSHAHRALDHDSDKCRWNGIPQRGKGLEWTLTRLPGRDSDTGG